MQFFIFLICLCCGVVSGIIYDILYIVRRSLCAARFLRGDVKDRVITIICDLIYCISFAVLYISASVLFSFPDLRLYMFIGCFAGAMLYIKSFHLFVAFLLDKLYNRKEKR